MNKIKRIVRLFMLTLIIGVGAFMINSNEAEAHGISELGLDQTDINNMVRGNDGYYYWIVINPKAKTYWQMRFKWNGQATNVSQIGEGTFDAWTDYLGCYVWNSDNKSNWACHDVYSLITTASYLNAVSYNSGGHINVKLDYDGVLTCFGVSSPTVNMYIKGSNRKCTLYNMIGNSSWANNVSIGYGAMLSLENGTQSLRTRELRFDGADHYTLVFSTCANAVYVADGCSYYSIGDEFLHGYTSAVISNHHSNGKTKQYGESYVKIDGAYIHDCWFGVIANNRLDIANSTFVNCTVGAFIGGTGGSQGGTQAGGINGLWNPWGSRGVISGCTIQNSSASAVRGTSPVGIKIGGNWIPNTSDTSIVISGNTIDTAGNGIEIDDLSGSRNINISNNTIRSSYGKVGFGVFQNHTKGGLTSLAGNNVYNHSWGLVNFNGNMQVNSGNYHDASDGNMYSSAGKFTVTGGNSYTASKYGIYNCGSSTLSVSGGSIYSNPTGIFNVDASSTSTYSGGTIHSNENGIFVGAGIVNVSGGTIQNNSSNAIYNNATLKMWGNPVIKGNIYLCSGKKIEVPNMLNGSGYVVNMPDSDKYIGKVVVSITEGNISAASGVSKSQTIAEKFALAFINMCYESNRSTPYKGYFSAHIRGGINTSGENTSSCILSTPHMETSCSNTNWTNIAPVFTFKSYDYKTKTKVAGTELFSEIIYDDVSGEAAKDTSNDYTYSLEPKYEGTHTFRLVGTDRFGKQKEFSYVTNYDITKPGIDMYGTLKVENDGRVASYFEDNILSLHTDDVFSRSIHGANNSSGIKDVTFYKVNGAVKTPIVTGTTKKSFSVANTLNAFNVLYDARDKKEEADYYLLVVSDFAGNISQMKIVTQNELLFKIHTSIDRSSYEN